MPAFIGMPDKSRRFVYPVNLPSPWGKVAAGRMRGIVYGVVDGTFEDCRRIS